MPRRAPILQDVAAHLAGLAADTRLADPVRWAYALRDAAALAAPDLLVSHHDPALEAAALRAALAADDDWLVRVLDAAPLADTPPAAAAVQLVATLAGIPLDAPVAAALSGPGTVAAHLAPDLLPPGADPDDRAELADVVGDALAALAGAYATAGAACVVVVDTPDGHAFLTPAERHRALSPIARAAAHARVELVDAAAPGDVVLSDGPLPADTAPADLRLTTT